jgi:hypothetical protein
MKTPPLPGPRKNAIAAAMTEETAKNHIFVLQDRKRLPARFFAELSGLATAHLR